MTVMHSQLVLSAHAQRIDSACNHSCGYTLTQLLMGQLLYCLLRHTQFYNELTFDQLDFHNFRSCYLPHSYIIAVSVGAAFVVIELFDR
jgi:hypothetical protein